MRTKLFLAFLSVMLVAFISNVIFERMVIRDFEDYTGGIREDRLYWVLASVEGSYEDGKWDMETLWHTLHWAAMLAFEVQVKDAQGRLLIDTAGVSDTVNPTMKRRMEGFVHLHQGQGEFESFPLFVQGQEIGELLVRDIPLMSQALKKEEAFKQRGRYFMFVSVLIAGGGAGFLALVLSLFISQPVRRLALGARAVAQGDLSVRVEGEGPDELGRLTASFNHMVESLKREEALRAHLTSNIAHELRTPLTVVKANLEAIADGVVQPDEETISSLGAEVDRLIALVGGIEDFTKAEAGFFKPSQVVSIELGAFTQGILQAMGTAFAQQGIALEVAASAAPVHLSADAEKLEICIRNLLANALKHSRATKVEISYGAMDKQCFVAVADNGVGIHEDDLPHVFKRFYKTKGSGGAGLGLAIVQELVALMAGRVQAQSAQGKGSTFTIYLPV